MSFKPSALSREKLKDLRSLSSAKLRKKKGICLVEGERALREAHRGGFLEYLVLLSEENQGGDPGQADRRFPGVPVYGLGREYFKEITDVRTGTGLLGVARIPPGAAPDVFLSGKSRSLLLFLDGLQEPGNVGGIIRTGWALGIRGDMLGPGTADPFGSKAVRASAGGVFHLPLFHTASRRDLEAFLASGYSLFLAAAGGADLGTIAFPPRSILVLGNEGRGASGEASGLGLEVGIPMAEGVDSLNVAAAGAIILAAMRRSKKEEG